MSHIKYQKLKLNILRSSDVVKVFCNDGSQPASAVILPAYWCNVGDSADGVTARCDPGGNNQYLFNQCKDGAHAKSVDRQCQQGGDDVNKWSPLACQEGPENYVL